MKHSLSPWRWDNWNRIIDFIKMYHYAYIGNHDFEEIVEGVEIKSRATWCKIKGDDKRKG